MSKETKWCPNCEQNVVAQDEKNSFGAVLPRVGIVLCLLFYFHTSAPEFSAALAEDSSLGIPILLLGILMPLGGVGLMLWWLDKKFSIKRCPICKGTDFLPPKTPLRSVVHENFKTQNDGH